MSFFTTKIELPEYRCIVRALVGISMPMTPQRLHEVGRSHNLLNWLKGLTPSTDLFNLARKLDIAAEGDVTVANGNNWILAP